MNKHILGKGKLMQKLESKFLFHCAPRVTAKRGKLLDKRYPETSFTAFIVWRDRI